MTLKLTSTLAALALFVAGCGSSSSSSSSSAVSTGASAPATTTAAASTSASASTSTTPSATPITITTGHTKLGTFLVAGSGQRTVYLFEADKGTKSTCYGKCAVVWPPVLGTATTAGGARSGELGVTHRKDGSVQVTYKGHPLYYYVKDTSKGNTLGAGINSFGAKWYVLTPSGNKIDNS